MRPVALLLFALGLIACTDDLNSAHDDFAEHELTGVVHMPLTARGADGKVYRLRNATFEITGAAMFTVGDRDAREPEAESLTATLPAGNYSVYLRPGWQLVEQTSEGTDKSAAATLSSSNPTAFEVGRTLETRVKLTLHSGEQDLVFGATGPMQVTSVATDAESAL